MSELDEQTPKAWDREAGEPARWFVRFTAFRLAGPMRSMLGTYNREREKAGKSGTKKRVPAAWVNAAEKWEWRQRAEQWDAVELERIDAEAEKVRDERRRALVNYEWAQAQMLVEVAERIFLEAAAMPTLGKRRTIADEIVETAPMVGGDGETAVAVKKLILETDAGDLLRTGARLAEIASALARRAVGWPTNFKPADAKSEAKKSVLPPSYVFTTHVRDFSGRPASELSPDELVAMEVDITEAELEKMTDEQLAAVALRLRREEVANMPPDELRQHRADLEARRKALDDR